MRFFPLRPIIFFSVVYFFIILPFYTAYNVQELVANSINDDYKQSWNGFKWSGYISLSILNWTNAIVSWFIPPLISLINSKRALALGAFGFNLALCTFLFPFKYGLYISTVLSGLSTSILWNSQGSYLGFISNGASATRDTGISWAFMESGAVFGNVVVTYLFSGKEHISANTRTVLYLSLISFGVVGIILSFFLKRPSEQEKSEPVLKVFGLQLSFFNSVYPTAVGYTKAFGVDRKQYAGEVGMLMGVGEVFAGILLILSRRMKKPEYILILAHILCILTFGSIYINLPDKASRIDTDNPAIIHSSLALALICAFNLGFTDGCVETQLYRCIITHYPNNASPPFAILTSIQALSMGIMYILSDYIGLHLHCILLSIACTLGIAALFLSYRVKDSVIEANDSNSQ